MKRYFSYVCNCDDGPHIENEEAEDGDWVLAEDAVKIEAELAAARAERDALREYIADETIMQVMGGGYLIEWGELDQVNYADREQAKAALFAALDAALQTRAANAIKEVL